MAQFAGKFQDASNREAILTFLKRSPPYCGVFMRRPAENLTTFGGWWYASILPDSDEIRALACVEETSATLYGLDVDALGALGQNMGREARGVRDGRSHHIFGEARSIDHFWEVFKEVGRDVTHRLTRHLLSARAPSDAVSARVGVATATTADERIVYEFSGEQMVEQFGLDPRRVGKQSHESRTKHNIQQGSALVARQGAVPFMAAEIQELQQGVVLLDKVFFPRPFRRKKLMAAGIAAAVNLLLQSNQEVLFFADEHRGYIGETASLVGFEEREVYRLLVVR